MQATINLDTRKQEEPTATGKEAKQEPTTALALREEPVIEGEVIGIIEPEQQPGPEGHHAVRHSAALIEERRCQRKRLQQQGAKDGQRPEDQRRAQQAHQLTDSRARAHEEVPITKYRVPS